MHTMCNDERKCAVIKGCFAVLNDEEIRADPNVLCKTVIYLLTSRPRPYVKECDVVEIYK